MDEIWIEQQGSCRATTTKFTVEVWKQDDGYTWAVYNLCGEYIFTGRGRTLEIAKRDALFAAR